MRRLGKVLHVSRRGSLILRTEKTPPSGRDTVVVDKKVQRIGRIIDVFGPVNHPYVAIKPVGSIDSERLVGKMLYLYRRRKK